MDIFRKTYTLVKLNTSKIYLTYPKLPEPSPGPVSSGDQYLQGKKRVLSILKPSTIYVKHGSPLLKTLQSPITILILHHLSS